MLTPRTVSIGVFALAFTLRLIFAWQWHDLPYGDAPLWDAKGHDDWATQILQGHFLQKTAFYSSPLYPYFLALLYKLWGHSFLMVSVVNAIIDSLTCVLLAFIAFECFGASAAALTGLLAAFCRSMIFYTAPVMKESLGLFLLAAFTWMLLRALHGGKGRDFALAGCCLGLCALVRGNALVLVPVVWAIIAARPRVLAAPYKSASIFVAAALFAILPATLHNLAASRDFVLINYDDGFNLYLGNSPWATGASYDFPPFINADPRPEEIVETEVAQRATGMKEMPPSAVSGYWRRQALDYMAENPAHSLSLLGTKFMAFWNAGQQFDNYDIPFIERNFSTILSAPLVSFWLIALLAAFASVALWPVRRTEIASLLALAIAYMASVLLFYVTERYRLPMIVFMLPLAGAALPAGLALAREKNWKRLAAAMTGTFLMLGLALWPRPATDLSAYDWGTLSSIEADRGNYQEALQLIDKAMAASPEKVGADGMIKASYAEERLGHMDKAMQWLLQARQFYPDSGVILYNVGRLQATQGRLTDALASFRQAIELTPGYALTYYAEAVVQEHLGRHAEAIESARRGLAVAPDDVRLRDISQQLTTRK